MLQLVNTLNADPWLCIPHLATDAYVAAFSAAVAAGLKAGLRAYVEYSNEVWNGIFDQTLYARQQVRAGGADVAVGGPCDRLACAGGVHVCAQLQARRRHPGHAQHHAGGILVTHSAMQGASWSRCCQAGEPLGCLCWAL
jgi:hypothetical protein